MMENRVKVTINKKTYNIRGDVPPEYIVQLAEYVDSRMKEVSRSNLSVNVNQIAILAAINIADEFFQLREIDNDATELAERKTSDLIAMLDDGLIGDVFSSFGVKSG